MGNAKYTEDNNDINDERIYYMESKDKGPTIYEPEETFDLPEKLEKIHEKSVKSDTTKTMSQVSDDVKNLNKKILEKSESKAAFNKPKEYEDIILCCNVCGKEFTFSKHDQKEYDKKGLCYPNRCPKCERRKYLPSWIKI